MAEGMDTGRCEELEIRAMNTVYPLSSPVIPMCVCIYGYGCVRAPRRMHVPILTHTAVKLNPEQFCPLHQGTYGNVQRHFWLSRPWVMGVECATGT